MKNSNLILEEKLSYLDLDREKDTVDHIQDIYNICKLDLSLKIPFISSIYNGISPEYRE